MAQDGVVALRRVVIVLGVMAGAMAADGVAGRAEACSCGPTPCAAAADYDAVFEATVEALDVPPAGPDGLISSADPLRVRLQAVRMLLGAAAAVVTTARSTVSCGFDFKVGRRYFIFASRGTSGELVVSRCGLTRLLEGSGALARYVESLGQPSRGGRMFGRVGLPADTSSNPPRLQAVAGATVRVEGSQTYQQQTTAGGEFEFVDLPPGQYRVTAVMPADHPERRASSPSPSCSTTRMPARRSTSIPCAVTRLRAPSWDRVTGLCQACFSTSSRPMCRGTWAGAAATPQTRPDDTGSRTSHPVATSSRSLNCLVSIHSPSLDVRASPRQEAARPSRCRREGR